MREVTLRMPPTRAKLLIGGCVVLSALSFLGLAAARSGWVYYVSVDEYVQNPPPARTRVHGRIESVVRDDSGVSFDLIGERTKLAVTYRGTVPPLFKAGSQVVAEGSADGHGGFAAEVLLTKCASKYQAPGAAP